MAKENSVSIVSLPVNDFEPNSFLIKSKLCFDKCSSLEELLFELQNNELDADWQRVFRQYSTSLQCRNLAEYIPIELIAASEVASKAITIFLRTIYSSDTLENDEKRESRNLYNLRGQSLFSLLRFNPSYLQNEPLLLIIIYQVICILEHFHQCGVPHLDISVKNVYLDNAFDVQLGPPNLCELKRMAATKEKLIKETSPTTDANKQTSTNFAAILQGWILNQISNYDYLMYINRLVNRSAGDSMASAIFPWITDFSAKDGGYRDLTKTKFRLQKGESQLDATYHGVASQRTVTPLQSEDIYNSISRSSTDLLTNITWYTSSTNDVVACLSPRVESNSQNLAHAHFIPHHLLDMMPNLAYFTYKARQTPIDMLKRYVRPIYRPAEFPSTMARLYLSTPEECIPEFFTDPNVFASIHSDMPDLGVPPWCDSVADFLVYHRRILESDEVSRNLHHWIDLTFGYKLLGDAAIEAKNVHLELAATSTTLDVHQSPRRGAGIACLFMRAHPRRACPRPTAKFFGPYRPRDFFAVESSDVNHEAMENSDLELNSQDSSNLLKIPNDYNPFELIEEYEHLSTFLCETCGIPAPEFGTLFPRAEASHLSAHSIDGLLQRDCEALGCFIVELSVHRYCPGYSVELGTQAHGDRVRRSKQLFTSHQYCIPACLRQCVEILLSCQSTVHTEESSIISSQSPTMLDLRTCFFHFPEIIIDLHNLRIGLLIAKLTTNEPEKLRLLIGTLKLSAMQPPGYILNAFSSSNVRRQFNTKSFLAEALPLLTALLYDASGTPCVIDALVSGRLIDVYLSSGGKKAVERHLVPLIQHIFQANPSARYSASSVYSRHFVRRLLRAVHPPVFLDFLPALLTLGLLTYTTTSSACADLKSATPISDFLQLGDYSDDTILRNFLLTFAPHIFGGQDHCVEDSTQDFELDLGQQKAVFTSDKVIAATRPVVPPVAAAQDSLLWLASLLGPVITGRRLVPLLLKSLTECFRGVLQLSESPRLDAPQPSLLYPSRPPSKSPLPMPVYVSGRPLVGDYAAAGILRCLERLAALFGVHFLLELYLPAVRHAVAEALLTVKSPPQVGFFADSTQWGLSAEAKLVASIVFLQQFVTYIPANYLMDFLQEPILHEVLTGALLLAGRLDTTFPSGSVGRRALMYKIIDAIYVIGSRVGFEITRSQMTDTMQLFFSLFDRTVVHREKLLAVNLQQQQPSHPQSDSSVFFCVEPEIEPALDHPESAEIVIENSQLLSASTGEASKSHVSVSSGLCKFVVQLDKRTSAPTVSAVQHTKETVENDYSELRNGVSNSGSSLISLSSVGAGSRAVGIDTLLGAIGNTSGDSLSPNSCCGDLEERSVGPCVPVAISEVREVFNAELAFIAYIPFCRLAGGMHVDSKLYNIEFIRRLVKQHEAEMTSETGAGGIEGDMTTSLSTKTDDRRNSSKMTINTEYEAHLVANTSVSRTAPTHLQSCWIDYFKSKLNKFPAFCDTFNFCKKQLVSFTGHTGAVKCITPLSNESSFVTCGQDRLVQLWSISAARSLSSNTKHISESSSLANEPRNQISESQRPARFVFRQHQRAVFSATYLEEDRLIASADGTVLLWDPTTGQRVATYSSDGNLAAMKASDNSNPASLLASISAMCTDVLLSGTILCGDESGYLVIIDPRSPTRTSTVLRLSAGVATLNSVAANDFLSFPSSGFSNAVISDDLAPVYSAQLSDIQAANGNQFFTPGPIRALSASYDSHTLMAGFSSGLVSCVDIRSGKVLAAWRAHNDFVSHLVSHPCNWFASASSSACDRSLALWRLSGDRLECYRSYMHSCTSGDSIVSATGLDRLGAGFIIGGFEPSSTLTGDAARLGELRNASPSPPSNSTNGLSSAGALLGSIARLGWYRPSTNTESVDYCPLGRIPGDSLRGSLTALASLSESRCFIVGGQAGSVSITF